MAVQSTASDLERPDGMSSYAALVDSVRRLTFMSKASTAMLMRDEPRDILAGVYALLRAELRLDCCFNYLVEDDATKLRLNFAAGVTGEQESSLEWLDFGQAVCGVVAVRRAEIVREDVQAARDPMVDLIRSMGITAYICEPLMAGDRLVGTFSVGTRSRTRFLREEIALLRTIAAPLAFALDRRRLIRHQRLLRQRSDRLQALTAALSSSATPTEVAAAVIEHTTAMFGAVGTIITRRMRNGQSLEILGARAVPDHIKREWAVFPVDSDVPLAEVVRTGDTVVIESPEEWSARYPRFAGLLEESGQHSLIAVPLVIESRTIGSMGVAFGHPRRFTRDDHNAASIIAQHCAQALERARLLEAEQLARQALESSDREKAELLASVSHDLRTPLNAIGGYVQLLQMGVRGELTEGQAHDLDRIAGNQRHLLHLVEELLRFSRETASPQPREIKRVPVVDALRTALDSVAP
ncbi:MAG: GAF domain-containing protein [Gemmatimonadaceae bacterium]